MMMMNDDNHDISILIQGLQKKKREKFQSKKEKQWENDD